MKEENVVESVFAVAGVVDANFNVYPEETLIEMAKDPRFRYDRNTKTLYLRVQVEPKQDTSWKSE